MPRKSERVVQKRRSSIAENGKVGPPKRVPNSERRSREHLTPSEAERVVRAGEVAKLSFSIHPHMLRHACGYKLANDGHDTRALQHYLGHKNIQHTVRYTEMAPDRFKNFWRD